MNKLIDRNKLLENSKSAILAGIEIYNKPQFNYREEVCVILFINAWQLLILAALIENNLNIYKDESENNTVNLLDGLKELRDLLPKEIRLSDLEKNLEKLIEYRNNSIHYYEDYLTQQAIHALIQAAIINYRDICLHFFKSDIAKLVNHVQLPLSFILAPDPIQFLAGNTTDHEYKNDFMQEIMETLENTSDTNRLLVSYNLQLNSIKKIDKADIIVGIDNNSTSKIVIPPPKNPNETHPYNRSRIIEKIKSKGTPINIYIFEAICSYFNLRNAENHRYKYAWKLNRKISSWCYSPELILFICQLSEEDINNAKQIYHKILFKK